MHRVNIESIEQAGDMVFCHANLPEDGSSEIHFSPLQGGEFEVGKPRGRLKTNELGFFVVATKAAKTPPICKLLWLINVCMHAYMLSCDTAFLDFLYRLRGDVLLFQRRWRY